MKFLLMIAVTVLGATSFASGAVEIRASDYTCAQISRIIQTEGKVFVRSGWFGRSFRYPPYSCNLGDKYTVVSFSAKGGEYCRMSYACVMDPNSPYNRH